MIREKNIMIQNGRALNIRPQTKKSITKSTRNIEMRRIENENAQLRAQKAHLKQALQMVLASSKIGDHGTAHYDAYSALSHLVRMEKESKVH